MLVRIKIVIPPLLFSLNTYVLDSFYCEDLGVAPTLVGPNFPTFKKGPHICDEVYITIMAPDYFTAALHS